MTKPFRLSGRAAHGDKSSSHERPRDEWIEIPVPAIVSEETFALAAERLADNKRFAPRRTIEPSIVQGLVSCRKCGYALSRSSTRTSARKIHYYRCLGSDAWRHLGGAVCDCRPIRQDLLDRIVWQEVIHLIEDPTLIRAELDRRLDAARAAEPTKRRREALERELTRIRKSMERLLTAYQEVSCPLTNCAVGCRNCAPASSPCGRNGRRSSIRPPTKYRFSDWPKPSPRSSSGYASRRKRWISLSGRKSSASWSRKS